MYVFGHLHQIRFFLLRCETSKFKFDLPCKTSLCTELETERDSVGSIDRVSLPRLDDHLLNTSCVAYFSQ